MTARSRKALADLAQEPGRAAFVVLAIAIGIAAFLAVLATYAILTRELNAGYLATNPASATLRTDAVDEQVLRAVLADRDVAAAEARRSVRGRIRAAGGDWRSLVLFAFQDFPGNRVDRLVPQKGSFPPREGEIAIERDAFQVARAAIGDTVTIRTVRGSDRTLRITASVHDVGQAQARMENMVYGYVTKETLAELGEEPYFDQLKILVSGDRMDETRVRRVARQVGDRLEALGHPVRRVDVPKPGEHPHAAITGLLLLSMSSFGLFALLLAGVLAANLLAAMMASEVRQVGVMKAMGGRRLQIARIYLGESLVLGGAALALAVPAGLVGARAFSRAMAVFLNFDITSFAVPAWVFLLTGAVGLLVPLAAAAWPVWKSSSVSVREALSDFGTARSEFGATAFDRALARVGGLARPLLLSIRNGFRRRARLLSTVATLAAGGVFFMTALNVRASFVHTLDRLFAAKKFDLSIALTAMRPMAGVEKAARATPGVRLVEGWIATEASLAGSGGASAAGSGSAGLRGGGGGGLHGGARAGASALAERFPVIGLPPETRLLALEIVEGRWLRPGDDDAIVVNSSFLAGGAPPRVGTRIALQMGPARMTWRVVGIAREAFSQPLAYVPRSFFERHGHEGMVNGVRVSLEKTDARTPRRAREALEENLEREGIRPASLMSQSEARFAFDQHMLMIYVFLIVTSLVLGGVGGLGLATTLTLNVLERRREMGILRAVGASPRSVWWIVAAEGAAAALLAWAAAGLAAWPLSKALGSLMVKLLLRGGLDFSFEPAGPLAWLGVSLVLGIAASVLPARRASRGPVREALAYE
ncbi:MAG TPA: ABC transporter permease [Thermoanaerobaculia bacterium]|nr:ABC transporter permease [Thermoanaerobaculia bacterium]